MGGAKHWVGRLARGAAGDAPWSGRGAPARSAPVDRGGGWFRGLRFAAAITIRGQGGPSALRAEAAQETISGDERRGKRSHHLTTDVVAFVQS